MFYAIFSFWFCFFSWSCCRKCSKYSTLEVERMFCPSWAWLCWWQGSVGLVGVTIRYRSPHVIPSLDLSASSNLISSCFERKYDVYSVLFVKTPHPEVMFYWTVHCGFVIYAKLPSSSNKLWETSLLFQSFKVNIDTMRKPKRFQFIFQIKAVSLHHDEHASNTSLVRN